jgi:uncharacterized protein DUF4360
LIPPAILSYYFYFLFLIKTSASYNTMLVAAATLFLGLAAALPARDLIAPQVQAEGPSTVKVRGVSLLGSGCPAGSGDVQVDATGELFEATFSAYEIQTGPGTMAANWRKNCKLTMNLEFERGFQ